MTTIHITLTVSETPLPCPAWLASALQALLRGWFGAGPAIAVQITEREMIR